LQRIGEPRCESFTECDDIPVAPQRRRIRPCHHRVPLAALMRVHDVDGHLVGGGPRSLRPGGHHCIHVELVRYRDDAVGDRQWARHRTRLMTSLVQAHGPDRGGVVGALSSSTVRASSSLRATGTDWSAVLRSSDAAVPGPTERRDGTPLRSHLEEAPNGIYAVVNQRRAWGWLGSRCYSRFIIPSASSSRSMYWSPETSTMTSLIVPPVKA
jgi:hypothetical protein